MRYRLESVIECSHDEMVAFSKALSSLLPVVHPGVKIIQNVLTADVKIADTPLTTTPEQSK